jgi:phage-related minor tail protein
MANQIIRAIEQVIIKLTIVEPLMKSFQSLFSGGINLSGFGFNPIAGATGSAHGNVFADGRIVPFARGGVVDSPSIAPMALFGEAGPEAIVPLKRGADGNLGISASGGGRGVNVTVNVHNAPAGVQSQTSRVDSKGNIAVDVILKKAVDGIVGDSLSNGSGRRVLARDFGVKPFMGQ